MPSDPERTCVGCRQRDRKRSMSRFVTADSRIVLDTHGNLPGRGAYAHPNPDCVSAATGASGLSRALRTALPEAEAARLRAEMERIVHE